MKAENFINSLYIKHPKNGKILFKLFDFQKKLLDKFQDKNHLVLLKSRQLGITELISSYALYIALTKPESIIWYFSPNNRSDSSFIKRVKYSFNHIENCLIKSEKETKCTLQFDNGSLIDARSSSDIVHRTAADLVIIDEAAWINNFDTIIANIVPCVPSGKIIIATTPSYFDTPFYNFWHSITPTLSYNIMFKQLRITWDLHPERDQEWYNRCKKEMSSEFFAMEYECKFVQKPSLSYIENAP